MVLVFRLVMLIIIILALLFCMSNLDPVTVKLLGWESPEMPLFLILMFVFFFGFFLALVWQAWSGVSHRRDLAPAPVAVPVPAKEAKVEKEKKERRWGLKKKNQEKEDEAGKGGTSDDAASSDEGSAETEKDEVKDNKTVNR